jgi:uridylate kinase
VEYIVIKLGGSLVSTEEALVNVPLVKSYCSVIYSLYHQKSIDVPRLILVIGGGNISRRYRDAGMACGEDREVDLHRIGMTACWPNAELFRALLSDLTFPNVLGIGVYAENRQEAERMMASDFERWLKGDKQVLVTGGFINGASTDFNAALLASKIGVDRFYKLTDVDSVYTSDPKKDMSAKPLADISWAEFFRLFDVSFDDAEHKPGTHIPVDLFAARLAHENEIGCFLTDGRDADVIKDIYSGTLKGGTFIH